MDFTDNSTADRCDNSFGPSADACSTPRFDFSLLFEQSILTIGPCSLLLLISLPRIASLARSKPKVLQHPVGLLKCVAYVALVALELALLVVWSAHRKIETSVSLAAASLGFVGALALSVLSYLEHRRSVRPSTIILTYLVFSIAFDAVQCRTLWLLREVVLAPVFTTTLACKVLVFAFELAEKRHILLSPWNELGPEATSSAISKSFFWWLNSLLLRGFQANLSTDTLFDIDDDMKSAMLFETLTEARQRWKDSRIPPRYRLLLATCDSLKMALVATTLPRLCLIGFKFAQPFLIKRVINYVQEKNGEEGASKDVGYALIGATGIVYFGTAITKGLYHHKLFRSLTMIRGALTSLIYISALKADAVASGGQNTAALTLVGPDVMNISGAFESLHEIWANPIEIVLSIWLLARELGAGAVGPAVSVIVCTGAMTRLAKLMGPAIKQWNEAIQRRITTTSSVLGSIKEVKMLGMVETWTKSVQSYRVIELQHSKKFRTFIAYMNVLGNTPSSLAPIITFGVAIALSGHGAQQQLSISTAFTSLTIMSLFIGPLARLLASVPVFFSSISSFERIEDFVDEGRKSRLTMPQREELHPNGKVSGSDTELDPMKGQSLNLIEAENVSFSIKLEEEPILKDLAFSIRTSTLTMITGKIGSGKTMLLLGLIGELETLGRLKPLTEAVAFCSQTPWLVNGTIEANILGLSKEEIDGTWYKTVLHACALDRDFQQLRDGDQSLVGSKGLTLSGGQRHRVALARALYSRKRVLIADDIFSGLDTETRNHVWTQVFGPSGLLRRLEATVIVATHAVDLIQHADQVIVLDSGKIAHQGSYAELRKSVSMLKSKDAGENDLSSAESSDTAPEEKTTIKLPKHTDDAEVDDLTRSAGDSSLYFYYLQSIGWKIGLSQIAVSMTVAFMDQFSEVWLKWWTEANDGDSSVHTGMYYGVYVAFLSARVILIGTDCWFMFVVLIPQSAEWLHWKLLESTMRAPMSFFNSADTGDLINRFSQDMSLVDRDLPTAAYTTLSGLLACIGQAALIILGAKYLAATLPFALLVLYALQKFYLRTSRQLRVLGLQAKAPLYTQLLEIIDGLPTIRAFRWQAILSKTSLELLDRSQRPHYLLFSIQRWLTLVLDLLVTVAAVLLVLFGVMTSSSTPGNIALAMYSVLGFSEALANFITSWTSLETSLGAIARLKDFVKDTPQENVPSTDLSFEPPPSWPCNGQLEWQSVTASYSGQEDGDAVLHDVSLKVQSRQKIAISGRTGSGKSSLLAVVFGLLDYSGAITVDGVDISEIPKDVLRSKLIVVPQHPVLFPGTLRSNLIAESKSRKFGTHSDDDVIALLKRLQVWDAICQSGSLDTETGNIALSYGQKQLLCLARAILRKEESSIIVLDEAMSAVDAYTEGLMVNALETEFAEHTVISVVHRLNTIRKFDELVVLEHGRIVQTGRPEELLTVAGHLKKSSVV